MQIDGDNKCNNAATTAFDSNQLIRLNLVPILSFFVRRNAENILQITNAFCSSFKLLQASSHGNGNFEAIVAEMVKIVTD